MKYIHLTRDQIEDLIDKTDLLLHNAKCNQATQQRIDRLETKITELYKALETKG